MHEHRCFHVTGLYVRPQRKPHVRGQARKHTLRVLALELLCALTSRRYSNTHLIDSYQQTNTRVECKYIAVRKTLTLAAYATGRTATQLDQDLRILKPGWEPTYGKGPIDKSKAEWVTPGLFTRHEGKIIRNLPSTFAGISRCTANTFPVRTVALLRVRGCTHTSASDS